MPSKTTKRARRTAVKPNSAPAERDDGTRWLVVRRGTPVYSGHRGNTKREALRLAEGLLEPAEIIQVSGP